MNKNLRAFLASLGLLFTAAIWGFAFVVVKDSLNSIGAVWMVAFRFTIAAVCMGLIFFKRLFRIDKKALLYGLVTGLFLGTAYIVQTIGCNYTTAGKNAFLTTIYVILIPILSWPFYKKRPGWHVFVAAFMSLTGIGLLALSSGDGGINRGDILTLICGLLFALHILWTEKCCKENIDPALITVLQFVFAALLAWLFAPFYDGALPLEAMRTGRTLVSVFYLGIFSTMVGFFLQNLGLKYVQSSIASLLLSFESVFGILFSTIFLREAFTARMFAGCALIFAAIVLAESLKKE